MGVFQSLKWRRTYIYFYTELITSKAHMLKIIFAGAKYFNEQGIYVQVIIWKLSLYVFYPAQAWKSVKTKFISD